MEKPQKLASGNYRQRYTGPNGKRYSTTDTTARKVQQKAALELAEIIANQGRDEAPKATRTRFDTFAEDWIQTRRPGSPGGYAVSTYRKRLNHLAELNRVFGSRMIEDVTPAEIRRWWNSRAGTPSYRDSLFWLLHMIFDVALEDVLIPHNPVHVRNAGKKASKKRPTFTDRDVEKLLDAAEGETKVMVIVLSWAGLRIGELLALDWADIDVFDARLEVTKHFTPHGVQPGTKTGAHHNRTIDLAPWVVDALARAWGGDVGPVFRNTRGGRLSIDGAERRFRALRAKAGLEEMHLHDLRHVALTNYARQPGVTLADVMTFGGHLSERVAMGYQHSDDERSKKFAAEAVAPQWVKS